MFTEAVLLLRIVFYIVFLLIIKLCRVLISIKICYGTIFNLSSLNHFFWIGWEKSFFSTFVTVKKQLKSTKTRLMSQHSVVLVKFTKTYNSKQNIWKKVKESSKIGQDSKSLISTIASFLTRRLCTRLCLQQHLSLKSFGNSWGKSPTKFVIIDKIPRFNSLVVIQTFTKTLSRSKILWPGLKDDRQLGRKADCN